MQISRLTITNVRTFERAEFYFQPGMNLLVGINGAGKSTVLDVLRTMCSQILPDFTAATSRQSFDFDKNSDISCGSDYLSAEMLFSLNDVFLQYSVYRPRREFIISEQDSVQRNARRTTDPVLDREGYEQVKLKERNTLVRVDVNGTPLILRDETGEPIRDKNGAPQPVTPLIPKHLKNSDEQPLVLYFSPHRSLPLDKEPGKTASSGGQKAAFADALNHRELRIREYADWWLVKHALSKEDDQEKRFLHLVDAAASRMLGNEYANLHALNKVLSIGIDGDAVNVRSLSIFHQRWIALFFEIARHLDKYASQIIWDEPIDIDFKGKFPSDLMSDLAEAGMEGEGLIRQIRGAFSSPDLGKLNNVQTVEFTPTNTLLMDKIELVNFLEELTEWWLNAEIQAGLFPGNIRSAFVRFFQRVESESSSDASQKFKFPHFDNIYAERVSPRLLIEKQGEPFELDQLSDGERSMLALTFDLSRRLALANPFLQDPIQEGKAVVLIDEIDLHLHPSWQRAIVDRLTSTFRQCQFIVTTHSPAIISELPPERVVLIKNGKVSQPNQSFGMDTNWIMRNLMDVSDRPVATETRLEEIRDLIDDGDYDAATQKLNQLREDIGNDEELVSLQAHVDAIYWDEDDEEDLDP